MVECALPQRDPFRCRTKEEYLSQFLSMLPRGRAWQSHDSISSAVIERYDYSAECGDAQCNDAQVGQPALQIERTVMAAYWAAHAELEEYFAQRACLLIDEFFCQSINEAGDVWADDYGFPDPCEPWTELCQKVAALGGATCEYMQWIAAQRGWDIDCSDCGDATPFAQAGCAFAGEWTYPCFDCEPNKLKIYVNVVNSTAYTQSAYRPAYAYSAMAGCSVLCEPSPQAIECIIERFKPAHVDAVYVYNYNHVLRPTQGGVTVASPEIGLGQLWTHSPVSIAVNSPTIGTPTLTEN